MLCREDDGNERVGCEEYSKKYKIKKCYGYYRRWDGFTGVLDGFISSVDNEPDEASITLMGKPHGVELFVNEIQSIKEI